jgi:hypothetical protein
MKLKKKQKQTGDKELRQKIDDLTLQGESHDRTY